MANICIPVGKIYWAEGPVGIKYVCVKGETREKGERKGEETLEEGHTQCTIELSAYKPSACGSECSTSPSF